MLGIRQLYPSSVVHVAHVLPLDDDLSQKPQSVLLAGIGLSVNVYRIERQFPSSKLTTLLDDGETRHDAISFTPTGHSINVGSMVIRIAALRHQIAIFLTRDMELIFVRYQANLSFDLNQKNCDSCNESVSHRNHWCILCRHASLTPPFGTQRLLNLREPVADPQLIVGESGDTAQAIIFKNNVHTIHIEHPKSESAVATNGLTLFSFIGRSKPSNLYHCAWFGEMTVSSGEFRFRNHSKSKSTYVYGESDAMRAQRLHEGWQQGSPTVADEDLMPDHSIKVLSQKKEELEKMASNSPARDPHLPVVRIGIDFLETSSLAPLPRPGIPTDCFVQLLNNRSSIYVSCLNMNYNSPFASPVTKTISCLRVQTVNEGQACSPYYIITAPPGPLDKVRARVYALSRAPTGQYIHRWQICKVLGDNLNVPEKGVRLTTSPERAISGVFLFLNKLCSLWLLLEDGSLTEIPDQILTMLERENARDQKAGDISPADQEGQFNDCLSGAWTRCDFTGLPPGFVPRSMQPLNPCGHTNPNPYIALTLRYVLLMDYACDAFVVDLQERCVVGGLLGEGAVTSVCRGPAHSMVVSHSKGTLTQLSPVVSAVIKVTKVLTAAGKDSNTSEMSNKTPLLKTAVQGLYPIWWGYANSEICDSLWGVLVCDITSTCLLSCNYHDRTCPLTVMEHRKEDGTIYWLSDEPTLYAAALCGANGGDFTLVQCTPTRLLAEQQAIDLPGRASHAAGCRVQKVVGGVLHTVILVAVILDDGLVLFSCSSVSDPGVSPTVTTPLYRQSHPWPSPIASVAIDMINEDEVAVLIGMWNGCVDFLRLKTTGGEALRTPTAVFHLVSPLCPTSISGFEDCGQSSVPRSIARMRCIEEAYMQWMILHDNTHLTVFRYGIDSESKAASKPQWKSITGATPSGAVLQGTGLSYVLKNSEDFSGFDILLLRDEEVVLLVAGAEGGGHAELTSLVRAVATMEATPFEFSSEGWQRGFAVQTRSTATGLLQHALFLTDGHRLVIASLPQLFRRGGGRETEHLSVVSPITYHLKRRMSITSNPSHRLTKTLYLSRLGLLMCILDCGLAQPSIVVVVSETSFKVCDFLQLHDQIATCAAQVPSSLRCVEAPDMVSQEIALIGTAPLEGSLGGGQVLVLLMHPLRIVHTVSVGEGAVMDLSVCRQTNYCYNDPSNQHTTEDDAEILVAACCGSLVCVYKLVGYVLYPLTSHRFEGNCTSISLSRTFVSVGLGNLGNAFLQLVYPESTSRALSCAIRATTDDTLPLEDGFSYVSSSATSGDSENEVLADETQSDVTGKMEGSRVSSDECIPTHLGASTIPKLRLISREPTLGGGVFMQDTYRDSTVRVDDEGGVYISHLSSAGKSNLECCYPCTEDDGDCQVVMTHCWGLPSATSALKVEKLMTSRAVEERNPHRLHWCERTGILLPVGNDCVATFFGCLDGSLFAAVELPYVFAFPLLRMEQIITDYNRNFESVSICGDTAYAFHSTTSKYNSCSLYSAFSSKLKGRNHVIPGFRAQYVFESVPFAASCALKAGTRVVLKKGAVWLDAVGEYFLLEKIVLGDAVRFEDLIPDAQERKRIEHKYHTLRNALINTLHEEYGNELSLMDCEEILNAW